MAVVLAWPTAALVLTAALVSPGHQTLRSVGIAAPLGTTGTPQIRVFGAGCDQRRRTLRPASIFDLREALAAVPLAVLTFCSGQCPRLEARRWEKPRGHGVHEVVATS
jgi:hypothetical protein